jgi:hypothetical protein
MNCAKINIAIGKIALEINAFVASIYPRMRFSGASICTESFITYRDKVIGI